MPAQSLWLDCSQHPALALEIVKPNFDDATFLNNTTFPTSVIFLSLRYPISTWVSVVTELPFAHGRAEFAAGFGEVENISESALGNPYLGLELRGKNSLFFAEIGARAPMTRIGNLAASMAILEEFADRLEAFIPEYLPLIALANFHYHSAKGFAIRVRAGPSFWINTEERYYGGDNELYLLYSAQAGYETETVSYQGGATGRCVLTTDDGNFGERSVHELGMAASFGVGKVWPGVQFRLPLDADLKEVLDFSVGLHVAVRLEAPGGK
jgi:hypothetical protein